MQSIWTYSPALMALYVAFNALILLLLNMLVSRAQAGADASGAVERAAQAHATGAKTLPVPLLMMLIATSLGAASWLIHAIGAPLTLGQILQGAGTLRNGDARTTRFLATVLTWISYIAGIAALIWLIFARQPG